MFDNRPPSPAFALVRRELLVLSRNERLFVLMGVMTACLMGVTLFLVSTSNFTGSGMAGFAKGIFNTQLFLLFVCALIIVPAAAAVSMVSERKQDCFPLLYTSLIPPGWIVWSKALSLLGLFAGLFIGLLPFSGLVYFFAGVEPAALFQSALVVFSLALGTTSIGLLASSHAKDHGRALYLTGVGVSLMFVSPILLRTALDIVAVPYPPWVGYLGPASAYSTAYSGMGGWHGLLVFAAYQGCIATLALYLARGRVLPPRDGWRDRLRSRSTARKPPVFVRPRPLIADDQNPIAAKDCMLNPWCRGFRPYVLGLMGMVAGGFLSTPSYMPGGMGGMMTFMMLERYILLLVIPPMMAVQFLAEREHDTWDSLRSTLLTGKDIVKGKMRAGWRSIRPLVIGLIVGRCFMYFGATLFFSDAFLNPILPVVSIGILLLSTYATMAISLHAAAGRQSTVAAIIMAYVELGLFSIILSIFSSLSIAILSMGLPRSGSSFDFSMVYLFIVYGMKYVLLLPLALILLRTLGEDLNRKLGPSRE